MTVKDHNRTLGILFLVYAGLQIFGLVIAGVVMLVMSGAILADIRGSDAMPAGLFVIIMIFALVFSLALLIPLLGAGLKLIKERPNARIWGIVGSIIALLNVPLGTLLGIYGLWFFFSDQGKQFYLGGGDNATFQHPPQPPQPNSWQ